MTDDSDEKIEKCLKLLGANSQRQFFSSFPELKLNGFPHLRKLLKIRAFQINVDSALITHLILEFYRFKLAKSTQIEENILNSTSVSHHAEEFFKIVKVKDHSQQSVTFKEFLSRFSRPPAPPNEFKLIEEQLRAVLGDNVREMMPEEIDFLNFLQQTRFLDGFKKIKSPIKQSYFVYTRIACYLWRIKGIQQRNIAQILPLKLQQVKKALQMFRKHKYDTGYEERRGLHKKQLVKIGQEGIDFFAQWIKNRQTNFTVRQLLIEYNEKFPQVKVSLSTMRRFLKNKMNFRFKKINQFYDLKNSESNKKYRFWFVHSIMDYWAKDELVVSIDESSFSSYNLSVTGWHHPTDFKSAKTNFKSITTNYSLILACSQEKVMGYYLVKGPIDAILFLDFFKALLESNRSRPEYQKLKVQFVLDNAQIHRSALITSYYREQKVQVTFTPPYSPDVHFIEHIFGRVKQKLRKLECLLDKLNKKL